jgi:hypothetical protein
VDSGLAALRRPGMTVETERRLVRLGFVYYSARRSLSRQSFQKPRQIMVITATELSPLVALIAGILILIIPRLLNIIVAIYLIVVGLLGLNAIHHFIH